MYVTAFLLVLPFIYFFTEYARLRRAQKRLKTGEPIKLKDGFLNIAFIRQSLAALKDGTILELSRKRYKLANAETYQLNALGTMTTIFTVDPVNLKAILLNQFGDFSQEGKHKIFEPLLGNGIFVADGARWKHTRAVLRPSFTRDEVNRVDYLESHVQNLIARINDHNGEPFDIQELFLKFTLDVICEIMLGSAPGLLEPDGASSEAESFGTAIDYLNEYFSKISFGQSKWLLQNSQFKSSLKAVDDFLLPHVDKALSLSDAELKEKLEKRFILIYSLAEDERDREELRMHMASILLAGRDTTALTLTWALFELSRNPEIWKKLQQEMENTVGLDPVMPLTFSDFKSMEYLSNVINETLRLHPQPSINFRTANKDTSIPKGGGPNLDQPVFVKKGDDVVFSTYVLHRSEKVYGKDALEFRPERWMEDLKPGWSYLPFNGGPRICLGQQLALNQVSYVLVRLIQNFSTIALHEKAEYPARIVFKVTSMKKDGLILSLEKY